MNRMTKPVTLEELPELQRKRAEAIKAAGTKWLLHPANHVQRKPPVSKRPLLVLLALLIIGSSSIDCDGQCVQTTEISK